MSWNYFYIALVAGLLAYTSASSPDKDGFEREAKDDGSNLRHWGERHGGFGFGFGGHHHQQRPNDGDLKAFCNKTNAWLASTAANVTVTNGTIPSTQELFVQFLTNLCSDTRANVPKAEPKRSDRHGWGGGWGWGGFPPKPTGSSLSTFCGRTETWLQTLGFNLTDNNDTSSSMQAVFINFLNSICEEETRNLPSKTKDIYNANDQNRHAWFNSPKPKRTLEVFCERTNTWLASSGINATAINSTGENSQTIGLFVDFLTNLCPISRQFDGLLHKKNIIGDSLWFNWGRPPPPPPSFSTCFGEFCDRTNSWLNTTAVNVTSAVNGTSLSAPGLFVNFLDSIC